MINILSSVFLFSLLIYCYILYDKNITFKNKFLILIYTIAIPIISCFGLKLLESQTFFFWRILESYNFILYLFIIALLEEICKFYLIPLFSKNILIVDKLYLITAFNFALIESLSYFSTSQNIIMFLYRVLFITPIHVFIGFLGYIIFSYINKKKNIKWLYSLIPVLTATVHCIINLSLSHMLRIHVIVFALFCIAFILLFKKKVYYGWVKRNNSLL